MSPFSEVLRSWLAHPLTRGLDIDDPRSTQLRRQIIMEKPFLQHIYEEWYSDIAASLPPNEGPILELGSGAGFLNEFIPELITSDVLHCRGLRAVLDALQMPFVDSALRAVVMTNVLHHIPQPRRFFAEASRCVRPGGVVAMIEPWVTAWSRVAYSIHNEPLLPEAFEWSFPSRGPLSGANLALPWMILGRDRSQFEHEFPLWQVKTIEPCMPFRYLLSGGVSMRSLMPGWTSGLWRALENGLKPWMDDLAMFAFVVLERKG